ncbi:hypothetical protein OBFLKGFO_00736 [Mannheimia haemolytica]|uniref:phage tail tape measure protein n=1 Tax=Mannheimia haemolytica TaxID=75985 RepID=UPI0031F5E2FC
MQQFGIKEEDIGRALDMAVAAGQAGNFELADMARWLPQQMAAGNTVTRHWAVYYRLYRI